MYVIKPIVLNVSEGDIRKALSSRDEDNLIVAEFGQLLRDMVGEYRRLLRENGNVRALFDKAPTCAMEKIALELLAEMANTGLIQEGGDKK
ncbi:MAG: hypothetical protein ACAH83_03555 [Alphaproteobacteria bacterium]